jgi:hypothetical protein
VHILSSFLLADLKNNYIKIYNVYWIMYLPIIAQKRWVEAKLYLPEVGALDGNSNQ